MPQHPAADSCVQFNVNDLSDVCEYMCELLSKYVLQRIFITN